MISRRVSPVSLALALTALLTTSALLPTARAEETDCYVRDPSTIVKRDGVYWLYGTGQGVAQFSSKDRRHWTYRGPVFTARPAWATALTSNKDGIAWAPDIHFWGGKYYLYYSYSWPGSKVSGIGVATNATLDPKGWVDQGVVVHSSENTAFNTIDPCIFEDANGAKWLSFGSYFDGIHLVRIDPATGKTMSGGDAGTLYTIAEHPQSSNNAIEASAVTYHDGWYYLFVNWDGCCAGAKSTYNIRVGRSKAVTGPYLDKEGKDMREGGGSLFLNAAYDDGSGRPCDDEVGPGHVGILSDTDGYWLGTHYEWARDRDGRTTVNVQKLAWDSDGWPRAVLDPGPFQIVSALASHGVVTASGSPLPLQPYRAAREQRWTLAYQGDGYYRLLSTTSGKALSLDGDATKPGAKTTLAPPAAGQDAQLWYLRQNSDGTYTLLSKSTGKASALDVTGCSLVDGAPLQQWTDNGMPCQKFSFRR